MPLKLLLSCETVNARGQGQAALTVKEFNLTRLEQGESSRDSSRKELNRDAKNFDLANPDRSNSDRNNFSYANSGLSEDLTRQKAVSSNRFRAEGAVFGKSERETIPLFADDWLVGEKAELVIEQQTERWVRAKLIKRLSSHPDRIKPPCPLFFSCGGCQLQHLRYGAQLELKRLQLKNLFEQESIAIEPYAPVSLNERSYRLKLLLPLRKKGLEIVAGFFKPDSHQLSIMAASRSKRSGDENPCLVHTEEINRLILAAVEVADELNLPVMDFEEVSFKDRGSAEKKVELRYLIARQSYAYKKIHLTLGVSGPSILWKEYTEALSKRLPSLISGTSLLIQDRGDNRWQVGQRLLLDGEAQLEESVLGMEFSFDPDAFFQINVPVAEAIWQQIGQWLDRLKLTHLLELYSGSGWLANWLALKGVEVVGLERDERGVQTALALAVKNGKSAQFFVVDLEKSEPLALDSSFKEGLRSKGALLVNPPRKGLSERSFEIIETSSANHLIYMACGQVALAKDAKRLEQSGWRLIELRAYDMFAQTQHIETISLFERS